MRLTEKQLNQYIKANCNIDITHITPETSLFESGLLDSIQLLGLIEFIEQETGIRIANSDVTIENIDTIHNILRFVSRALS